MFHAIFLFLGLASPNFHVGDITCSTFSGDGVTKKEFATDDSYMDLHVSKIEKVGKHNYLYSDWEGGYGLPEQWSRYSHEEHIDTTDDREHLCTQKELFVVGLGSKE